MDLSIKDRRAAIWGSSKGLGGRLELATSPPVEGSSPSQDGRARQRIMCSLVWKLTEMLR